MMWPGAEPEKGVFNESYFNLSKTLINTLVSMCDRNDDATIHNFHLGDGGGDGSRHPLELIRRPLPSLELLEKVRQFILYSIERQKLKLHNKHFTNRS